MANSHDVINRRQEALVTMIFSQGPMANGDVNDLAGKGLQIYRNNLLMTANRALTLKYPVVTKMLGDEAMLSLTQMSLELELPESGDWADWGECLPEVIQESALDNEHPYLAEVAGIERILHQVARKRAASLNVNSLSALGEVDLSKIYLRPSPSLQLYQSQYAVDQIWHLHQSEVEPDVLFNLLNDQPEPRFYLLYQKDHQPCIRKVEATEYAWVSGLLRGHHLDFLLDANSELNFPAWLSRAIEEQWLEGLIIETD